MGFLSNLFGGGSEENTFKAKVTDEILDGLDFKVIYIKGCPFADNYRLTEMDLSLDISMQLIFQDKTNEKPLLTAIPQLQHSQGPFLHIKQSMGSFSTRQYFPKWVEALRIPDEEALYTPPYSDSEIECLIQIYSDEYKSVTAEKRIPITFYFNEVGYLDFDKKKLDIEQIGIKLASAIAISDGTFDRKEGNVIKNYAKNLIELQLDDHRDETKEILNEAIEESVKRAKNGPRYSIKRLCQQIKDIEGYLKTKYEALELCLDVMAADNEADKEELKLIEKIATLINIDYDEFVKLRDKRMIGLTAMSDKEDSSDIDGMERTIGIQSKWTVKEKIKHCKKEFRKWNGRLGSLNDRQKQKNAQKILNIIGVLLQHYEK